MRIAVIEKLTEIEASCDEIVEGFNSAGTAGKFGDKTGDTAA